MSGWRSGPAPGRCFARKREQVHESHHRRWSGRRRILCRAPSQARRERRNPDGGAGALRFLRELRAALPCRRRHQGGGEPAGRNRGDVPRPLRHRCAHGLRGDRNSAQGEKGQAARRAHRRGGRAFLRQAGSVARRRVHPPAAAGDRPSGHLPCPHSARRAPDQRMDRIAPHRGREESPAPWLWAAASSAWRWPRT